MIVACTGTIIDIKNARNQKFFQTKTILEKAYAAMEQITICTPIVTIVTMLLFKNIFANGRSD